MNESVEGECILWNGYIHPQGYGKKHIGKRKWRNAHVFEWEKVNGPKPEGMVLDHLCRNRACINLKHLELVTPVVNTLRGEGPTAVNARKTHCKHGHEFSGANLTLDHRGHRRCVACQRRQEIEYRERKSARIAATRSQP